MGVQRPSVNISPTATTRPTPVRRPRRRRKVTAGGLAVFLILTGVRSVLRYQLRDDDSPSPAVIEESSAPLYPAVWDDRVVELVTFVETERGLTFFHPVDVQFLAEPDFIALVHPGVRRSIRRNRCRPGGRRR